MKRVILIVFLLLSGFSLKSFELISVFPRIFSPGDDGRNDRVFFEFVNPDLATFTLRIYDLKGRLVADLPTGDPLITDGGYRIFWDGKDRNQKLVEPGIYIYIAEINQKIYSGTIVVAR